MIKHYFRTAIRFILKNKAFAAINLIGLVTALIVCFFALSYVRFELSYDRSNTKIDRIYRLATDIQAGNGTVYESSSAPMAPAMQVSFPEIQASARVLLDYIIVQNTQNVYNQENIAYVDTSVFSIFTLPMVRGGSDMLAMSTPFKIILSESAAKKYFGNIDNAVGGLLLLNGKDSSHVVGVMKDMPHNAHFRADILLSMPTLLKVWNPNMENQWRRFGFYTYLLLKEQSSVAGIYAKLPGFVNSHFDQSEKKYSLSLEPLKDIYFNSRTRGSRAGSSIHGNIKNLYIFSLLAVFVLFIACFNFINLTTVLSINRSKEIGVRKVLGAARRQLIFQFLSDALVLSLLAFIIAIVGCILLMPLIDQVTGKKISDGILNRDNALILFFVSIAAGILAGIYPAFVLSASKPVTTIKTNVSPGARGTLLRKSLVVVQFSLSLILIISTIVVYRQLHFMQNQELGFKKDHRLVIDFQFDKGVIRQSDMIKREVSSIAGISKISISSGIPGRANHTLTTNLENSYGNFQDFEINSYFIDNDFLNQYGIQIVAGRGFSREYPQDTAHSVIINETAAKTLGFRTPQDAIGRRFSQTGQDGLIIGVIKDFRYHSFREAVQPLTLRKPDPDAGWFTFMTIDISSDDMERTVNNIMSKWKEIVPDLPMTYFFADDAYNEQYTAEMQFGKLFLSSAVIAIIISCLGILGLSSFTIAQRTKEIGIRKVLGSSIVDIVFLLTKEILLLTLIAFLIGLPFSVITMNNWLKDFAYHIDLSWWIFALAAFITLVVSLCTISAQTIRAATANPMKSLKAD